MKEDLETKIEDIMNKDISYTGDPGEFDEYGVRIIRFEKNAKKETTNETNWEHDTKIGFYKTKTHISKYKIQLFPDHLPYDELKKKRAFLFC